MEAVSAGFGAAMRDDDYSLATYRGHAHTLSRGASMEGVIAELLGRDNGLMRGKGGSMHLVDVENGMLGSYGIVGSNLPIANGAAWSAQLRGSDQVTVCFFGDGGANIGAFHEALNLAAVWELPVVFVCENNLYMEYTPIDLVTAVEHPAASRASAYGLEEIVIDGQGGGDTFTIAGDFTGTSLAMSTIHVMGSEDDDVLDDGEMFDKMEIERVLAEDPKSLPFVMAKKEQRKYARAGKGGRGKKRRARRNVR